MPIVTDFKFGHEVAGSRFFAATTKDFRGDLVQFLAGGNDQATWKGVGFNMIWRPDHEQQNHNPNDFFLELNETTETLSFKDITGGVPGRGIANRGALQKDIQLGGIAYTQEIFDANETQVINGVQQPVGLHFEPGVWINVEKTEKPNENASIARMGSVPHGTTINLQGVSLKTSENANGFDMSQIIKATAITPSRINATDSRDESVLQPFPKQETIDPNNKNGPSRTSLAKLKHLDQTHLANPNQYLMDALAGQKITKITTFVVASDPRDRPGQNPNVGGGVTNIAFLLGNPDPNSNAMPASAIFWLEEGVDGAGKPFRQLQYTQRVLLKFNGLNWPHITVGTLRPV